MVPQISLEVFWQNKLSDRIQSTWHLLADVSCDIILPLLRSSIDTKTHQACFYACLGSRFKVSLCTVEHCLLRSR